jgi:hypothetical protein
MRCEKDVRRVATLPAESLFSFTLPSLFYRAHLDLVAATTDDRKITIPSPVPISYVWYRYLRGKAWRGLGYIVTKDEMMDGLTSIMWEFRFLE